VDVATFEMRRCLVDELHVHEDDVLAALALGPFRQEEMLRLEFFKWLWQSRRRSA